MTISNDNQSSTTQLVKRTITDGVITAYDVNNDKTTWVDTRIGTVLPGWRGMVKRGVNATTAYNCTFQEWMAPTLRAVGTVTQKSGAYTTREFWDTPPGFWSVSPSNPASYSAATADLAARSQFLKRYRHKRTQFQSGVFLGELMETVKMIRHPAEALRRGIDDYYRTVKKRIRRHGRSKRLIQDTWLEYVFGWAPLVNDAKDALKLATADTNVVRKKIRSDECTERLDVTKTNNQFTYGHTRAKWTHVHQGEVMVKIKGAVSANMGNPGFPEQCGLSWSNFLPTIWELIPYSFLFDYFTNIGTVIDGISTGKILLDWGCKITRKQASVLIDGVTLDQAYLDSFKPIGGRTSGFATGGGVAATRTELVRQYMNQVSVGLGDFAFKLPGSGTKWLNIAALAKLRR